VRPARRIIEHLPVQGAEGRPRGSGPDPRRADARSVGQAAGEVGSEGSGQPAPTAEFRGPATAPDRPGGWPLLRLARGRSKSNRGYLWGSGRPI